MNDVYARDLDLNLLRVFVVVAECGSVTEAARRLFVTQPAVSAALRRLGTAVGAPLVARSGRGIVLTAHGRRLLRSAQPHLRALVGAALAPTAFDPLTSDRVVRLGLTDSAESWLLPALLQYLDARAPRMRFVVIAVDFRTVGAALASGAVDLAVTVLDDLPAGMQHETLFHGSFRCVYDPRHVRLPKTLTVERYLAADHVIVSYAGDLRGMVEDLLGHTRRVRVSVPSFHSVGAIVSGSALLATVPDVVAREIVASRPALRTRAIPFEIPLTPIEICWPRALDDDEALSFVRHALHAVAR